MQKVLRNPWFYLIVILVIGTVLRFYKLGEYMQFLGDEGRDVLVVKQMITDHKWTLLGPTASVGGFYTGPIYYYFMLPFLWAFRLDPIGPAVMSALFGIATIVLTFVLSRRFFNDRVAVIAAFLVAISPKMIEISRFSWNPNPVPFFSLLTIFFLYLSVTKKRKIFTILSGVGLGILFQLHYIDLVFGAIGATTLILLFPPREWIIQFLLGGLGFVAGDSLFLLFELRHGFPNTQSMMEFITRPSAVSPRNLNPLVILDDIGRQIYEVVLGFKGGWLLVFYYSSILGFIYWAIKGKEKVKITILLAWAVVGTIGIGFYRGNLLPHYFSFLFPVPLIFIAASADFLLRKRILWPVFLFLMATLFYFEIKNMYFWGKPNNMVTQTKTIDSMILDLAGDKPFNFALIAPGNSDHAYRYFLDVWNRRPVVVENEVVDPKRQSVTSQLIVVCEQPCGPLGYSLWEIAGFGRAEIDKKLEGPAGIDIYKLVHYQGKE